MEPGRRPLYEDLADDKALVLPPHSGVSGGAQPNATPDVLFVDDSGAFPIVADVKYTNVTRHADRSELEQVMTYGARYRSPVVLTIHPRRHNAAGGLVVVGTIGDVLVAQYRVDLAADELDAEMETMAESLEALIGAISTTT